MPFHAVLKWERHDAEGMLLPNASKMKQRRDGEGHAPPRRVETGITRRGGYTPPHRVEITKTQREGTYPSPMRQR